MLYRWLIRPIFFRINPEKAHHMVVSLLKFGFAFPGFKELITYCTQVKDSRLEKELFGLHFKNRIGIAAGFDKNAEVYNQLAAFGFGHIEIGTVTPKGQPGNPKPRLFRLPKDKGLINRMGFNNNGCEAALTNLQRRTTKAVIGVNIGKNTLTPNETAVEDYWINFRTLFNVADYFVVNVSCPNISDLRELQDQEMLTEILMRLQDFNHKQANPKPILLKVSPDLNEMQLDEVIDIVKHTKIDGVVAVNTTITRHTLKVEQETAQRIGNGGLSGQPIHKRAVDVIRYLSEKSGKSFPIIGVGGIFSVEDAIEQLQAGADLIQVYTGFIYEGPMIARRINKGILKAIKSGELQLS